MSNTPSPLNLGLVIGTLGCIAGIILFVGDSRLLGLFGAIASAGVAYKGYLELKAASH